MTYLDDGGHVAHSHAEKMWAHYWPQSWTMGWLSFSLPDSVKKYIFRHNNDLHIQHLFQYYNKKIIFTQTCMLNWHSESMFCTIQQTRWLIASSYDPKWGRKRNIHIPWTISTVQCFSFSSTVDNWVEFAIFCLVLVLLCLIKMHFSTVTSILWLVFQCCTLFTDWHVQTEDWEIDFQ